MSRFVSIMSLVLFAVALTIPASAQSSPSGGIGLSLDAFAEMYGAGEPGQSLTAFTLDDGSILNVGIEDGSVDYIEIDLTGTADGGLLIDDAEALAASFLPADIEPNERYTAPGGPKQLEDRLDVITWESDWLEDDVFSNRENIVGVFTYQRTDLDGQLNEIATSIVLSVED
jgi:hypothetical protein